VSAEATLKTTAVAVTMRSAVLACYKYQHSALHLLASYPRKSLAPLLSYPPLAAVHPSVALAPAQNPGGGGACLLARAFVSARAMTNQDVVFPDMGIAAATSLPGSHFACRGTAGAISSLRRGAYGGLPAADEFLGSPSHAATGWACTGRVVEALRASSPTRPPTVDECAAWRVSCRLANRFRPVPYYVAFPCCES
jgi:hypothetical protein